jgi:hypothetical protein
MSMGYSTEGVKRGLRERSPESNAEDEDEGDQDADFLVVGIQRTYSCMVDGIQVEKVTTVSRSRSEQVRASQSKSHNADINLD